MNAHQFLVEDILSFAENQLSLTSTRLTSFTLSSLFLGHLYHSSNATFLLKLDKLLSKVVHGLGNDGGLESFSYTIDDALLIALDEVSLLRLGTLSVLGSDVKLLDQVETHFLASEHIVLSCTTTKKSLETDDSDLTTITNCSFSLGFVSVREIVLRGIRSDSCSGLAFVLSLEGVFLSVCFLSLHVNYL